MESRWQSAYRTLSQMKALGVPAPVERATVDRFVIGFLANHLDRSLHQLLDELNNAGYSCPSDWRKCVYEVFDAARAVEKGPYPYEDVYAAALMMAQIPSFLYEDRSRVYRGQRCVKWPFKPNIFRGHTDFRVEQTRLTNLLSALRNEYPAYCDEQLLAIIQHYSEESKTKTWLLDVTRDPFVALFFASHHGKENDVGVVVQFTLKAWEEWSVGGSNLLGEFRFIDVPLVPRIGAQKAVFLDGAHPDLLDQYVPYEIQFCQKGGLTFEDQAASISEAHLLRIQNDPFATYLAAWNSRGHPLPTDSQPITPRRFLKEFLTGDDYLEMIVGWFQQRGPNLTSEHVCLLRKLCSFHAMLQGERVSSRTSRSLQRLKSVAEHIVIPANGQGLDITWQRVQKLILEEYSRRFFEDAATVQKVLDRLVPPT